MRRHPVPESIELLNEDEIEAALNAAIDRPLDDLLTIEEFAEKYTVPAAQAADADRPEESLPDLAPDLAALAVEATGEALRDDAAEDETEQEAAAELLPLRRLDETRRTRPRAA